jgi:cardiolipin synthase
VKASDLPNIITFLRFLLIPPVVLLLLQRRYDMALLVFAVAGFSDALDGYLAKRYRWSSRLGGLLDPIADKLMLLSGFVTLAWLGVLPVWLVALIILRDVVIVTGAIVYHLRIEKLEAEPSVISKFNTLAQILLILAEMFSHAFHELPQYCMDALIYGVLVTTLWSGFDYVWTWGRRAWRRREI